MKISVCLASFNGAKYIRQQIDSILCQLSFDDELIISDDGSTDGTQNQILSYNDPRIRLFSNQNTSKTYQIHNYQVTGNFENALKHASGDIIFLCDQDDVWLPQKISEVLKVFDNKEILLVVHDASVVDDAGKVIADSYFSLVNSRPGFVKNLFKNAYLGCCMAFRRSTLEKSLPFPENLIAHDMWIGLMGERFGKVLFIDRKLIKYRRHGTTATAAGGKSSHGLLFKIYYRLQFLMQYLYRILSK